MKPFLVIALAQFTLVILYLIILFLHIFRRVVAWLREWLSPSMKSL
jgi:hypothetical protein